VLAEGKRVGRDFSNPTLLAGSKLRELITKVVLTERSYRTECFLPGKRGQLYTFGERNKILSFGHS